MFKSSEYKYHSFGEKKDADAVQVMTVHKAKGLEFEAVILPEMEEREFPVGNMGGQQFWHILGGTFEANKSKYQSDLEDERKLFYVAVTRAKWELLICFQLTKNRVSTFVKEATASMAFQYDPRDFSFDDGGCSDQHQLAAKARHLVIDYYGTAMHSGMWAAGGDLVAVQQMSDARVIEEARRLGLL